MNNHDAPDANRDPITGTPGAHPVGTGVGAAAGGTAGAAIGSVAGPVGTLVGVAVGAVAGGLGGKAAGEAFNPTAEDAYWRENYRNEAYVKNAYSYDDYEPAYRTGYASRSQYADRSFDQGEPELRNNYEQTKGNSRLVWNDARDATRAAWHRVEHILPGDADRDGRWPPATTGEFHQDLPRATFHPRPPSAPPPAVARLFEATRAAPDLPCFHAHVSLARYCPPRPAHATRFGSTAPRQCLPPPPMPLHPHAQAVGPPASQPGSFDRLHIHE